MKQTIVKLLLTVTVMTCLTFFFQILNISYRRVKLKRYEILYEQMIGKMSVQLTNGHIKNKTTNGIFFTQTTNGNLSTPSEYGNTTVQMKIKSKYDLPLCPERKVRSDTSVIISYDILSFSDLVQKHGQDVEKGGHYRPVTCYTDQTVAIIIPYRDREDNLKMLLNNLHPFLKRQNIEYTMFVTEQLPGAKFNRGLIKNIGFVEAMKIFKFDCVFFHDIDMTPDNLGNVYRCGKRPRLHARRLTRYRYKVSRNHRNDFGGVVSMMTDQFIKANGYTNTFFEWGCEDEELKLRLRSHNVISGVYPFHIASYKEFQHQKVKHDVTQSRKYCEQWKSRLETNGLNALYYNTEKIEYTPLYTHIYVNINMTAMTIAYEGRLDGIED